MNGSLHRPRLRAGLVLGAIACLVLSLPMSASAGWTKESVTDGSLLWYPALAVEPNDDLDVIYTRIGSDPGLFFATNTGGSWSSTRVTSGDDWAPDIVLDGAGHLHVAFASTGSDTGIHYLTNAGGGWTDARVSTEPEVDRPSIALDGSGHVHIVYAVHGADPGLYHVSDETGGWVRTRLIATPEQWSPDLAIDTTGTLHVVSARFSPEAPGLYYMKRAAGAWSIPTHITNAYDDWPSIAVDAGGNVSLAFQRFGLQPSEPFKGQLWAGSSSAGNWYFERLTGGYQDGFFIGPPDVKLVSGGIGGDALHIVVRERSTDPAGGQAIYHYVKALGLWGSDTPPLFVPGAVVNEPTLAILSDGSYRIAYGSFRGETAGIFLSGTNSAESVATSRDDTDPTILSEADGTRHLTFDRANATPSERGIHYGDDSGGWSFERTQIGPSVSDVPGGETDLGLAPDGSARILTTAPTVTHMTNQNGTWEGFPWCCGPTEGALAVDPSGVSHVALIGDPQVVRYATNAGATWSQMDLWFTPYAQDTVGHPEIVVDASGRRTVLFAYRTPVYTPGLYFISSASGGAWPAGPTRLASGRIAGIDAVADASNKLHVAWLDEGTNPGIYYATNKTGTWITTRFTRSIADTVPTVALDPDGDAYVAFSRGYWAATPGVYLATDSTGAWQISRVSEDPYAGRPSVDIGPDGLADIAYVNDVDGVSILAQNNGANTSANKAALRGALANDRPTIPADEGMSPSARTNANLSQPDRHIAAP